MSVPFFAWNPPAAATAPESETDAEPLPIIGVSTAVPTASAPTDVLTRRGSFIRVHQLSEGLT
ncbi:MAG: hypothetical protein WCD21_28835 [Streptomyces sp.]